MLWRNKSSHSSQFERSQQALAPRENLGGMGLTQRESQKKPYRPIRPSLNRANKHRRHVRILEEWGSLNVNPKKRQPPHSSKFERGQ